MKILLVILFLLPIYLWAITPHEINIDGTLADWSGDELILNDNYGDSWWGESNEIDKIYLTWSNTSLYIGAVFSLYNNAFLLVLDTGLKRGVTDIKRLDWYPRDLVFQGFTAEAIIALWNGELSTGGFRLIRNDGHTLQAQSNIVLAPETGRRYILEAKIPWSSLYQSERAINPGAILKVVSAICAGDYSQAGDIAPNQPPGTTRITTYFELPLDKDNNGFPDDSVAPAISGKITKSQFIPLSCSIISITPEIFNPKTQSQLEIKINLTIATRVNLSIFSIVGEEIKELIKDETLEPGEHVFLWNGKDRNNKIAPTGIYIVNLIASDAIMIKKAFVIVQ